MPPEKSRHQRLARAAAPVAFAATLLAAPALRSQSAPAGESESGPHHHHHHHHGRDEAHAPDARRGPYDHVLIVSFDGMRPDAIALANAPNLQRLRAEGANALAATTIPDASTLPSHASMLTGTEEAVHGMNFDDFHPERDFVRAPTVFYLAHDAGLATAMFVTKAKLRHVAVPGSLDVWSLPHWSCERVSAAAAEYLPTARPGVTFVHYSEPDDAGHAHHWMSQQYLDAIARSDACLGTVLAAAEHRAPRGRLLVILTADHGGHGRRHGTLASEDQHIPWIAWGSRTVRGDFDAAVSTMDTAATTLAALGLPAPREMQGHVVRQALEGTVGP